VRRDWIRVALAAGAGLVSLVACFGAFYAIQRFHSQQVQYHLHPWLEYSEPASTTLRVVMVATVILALASFTLPPLALGARPGRVLSTSVLCSIGFYTFANLYFVILTSGSNTLNTLVVYPLMLMVLVGTSALGSLVAVHGEGRIAARILPATLIAALTIYCASLFAIWATTVRGGGWPDLDWPTLLIPIIVAAFSWPVLPGIVASLRSD